MKVEKVEITNKDNFAIFGGGNIGSAIAKGLIGSGRFSPGQIIIT
jgi:pyrroline-5-carboxylate reductase